MNKIRNTKKTDALFEKVAELIEQARCRVVTAGNLAEVYTKYRIGQYIVEDEQKGRNRAQYGQQGLKNLSDRLTKRFGSRWSLETLKNCRSFYSVYCSRKIGSTVFTQLPAAKKVDGVYPIPRTNIKDSDSSLFLQLTHQDLGQMQMYVNYFDRNVKLDFEKPTIGILLCKTKKDALVELTLPKEANIYASAYELCLPDKTLLQQKLQTWINEFENNSGIKD